MNLYAIFILLSMLTGGHFTELTIHGEKINFSDYKDKTVGLLICDIENLGLKVVDHYYGCDRPGYISSGELICSCRFTSKLLVIHVAIRRIGKLREFDSNMQWEFEEFQKAPIRDIWAYWIEKKELYKEDVP